MDISTTCLFLSFIFETTQRIGQKKLNFEVKIRNAEGMMGRVYIPSGKIKRGYYCNIP